MYERATTSGHPDLRSILLNDMKRNTTRLGSLIERRRRLGNLKGDRREVEEVSIELGVNDSHESQAVLSRLAKRFE